MQEIERLVDAHLFRLLLAVKHRLSPGYSRGLDAVRCVQREIEPEPYPKADAVAGIDDLRAYETKHARTSIKWELDSLALSTMGAWLVLLFFEVAVRLARPVPFWPDSLRPLTRAPQVYLVIAGSVIVLAFLFWRFGNRLARFVPRRATARQQVRTDSDSGIAGA
jgi:hypothetical protein